MTKRPKHLDEGDTPAPPAARQEDAGGPRIADINTV
jgi:hypothetical protein